MAHARKVSPPLTPIIPKSISLMDCVEKCGDDDEPSEMELFASTLHGETKLCFEIILDQHNETLELIEKKEEHIFKLDGHARDYVNEISSLSQSLEEEKDLRMALEASKIGLEESHTCILLNL
jgi:hypothetical protein